MHKEVESSFGQRYQEMIICSQIFQIIIFLNVRSVDSMHFHDHTIAYTVLTVTLKFTVT